MDTFFIQITRGRVSIIGTMSRVTEYLNFCNFEPKIFITTSNVYLRTFWKSSELAFVNASTRPYIQHLDSNFYVINPCSAARIAKSISRYGIWIFDLTKYKKRLDFLATSVLSLQTKQTDFSSSNNLRYTIMSNALYLYI